MLNQITQLERQRNRSIALLVLSISVLFMCISSFFDIFEKQYMRKDIEILKQKIKILESK